MVLASSADPGGFSIRQEHFADRQNLFEVRDVRHLRSVWVGFSLFSLLMAFGGTAVGKREGSVSVPLPGPPKAIWITDYKKAQEEAKANHKLVLLNFTGSDWCGPCIKLDKEILSKPELAEYAANNLVLVELDFPRRKQLADSVRQQNEVMAERYQIQRFPTIIVLNGEGQKVGELG